MTRSIKRQKAERRRNKELAWRHFILPVIEDRIGHLKSVPYPIMPTEDLQTLVFALWGEDEYGIQIEEFEEETGYALTEEEIEGEW